jgi:hypothetical protein
MDAKLAALVTKIKLDEFVGQSNSIIYNSESYYILDKLNTLFNEKFDECLEFINNMKKFTTDAKVQVNKTFYGKIIFEGNPIKGREKEYQINMKNFYACSKQFDSLDNAYSTRNIILEKQLDVILENCVKENCQIIFKNGDDQSKLENCIRDCLKFDLNNKFARVRLSNENNLKFINDLQKL